jgi:hypothetical protein
MKRKEYTSFVVALYKSFTKDWGEVCSTSPYPCQLDSSLTYTYLLDAFFAILCPSFMLKTVYYGYECIVELITGSHIALCGIISLLLIKLW